MAITILPPVPNTAAYHDDSSYYNQSDSEGDVDMEDATERPTKQARTAGKDLVTPGETITDDPQWMRYVIMNSELDEAKILAEGMARSYFLKPQVLSQRLRAQFKRRTSCFQYDPFGHDILQ